MARIPAQLCLTCLVPTTVTAGDADLDPERREWRCACDPLYAEWLQPRTYGRALSMPHHICSLCARTLAPLSHQWSYLACTNCWELNKVMGDATRKRLVLPLGRHSMMNGVAVTLDAVDDEYIRYMRRLVDLEIDWEHMRTWKAEELRRVVAGLPRDVVIDGRVALDDFVAEAGASRASSADAWLRCVKAPSFDAIFGLGHDVDDRVV